MTAFRNRVFRLIVPLNITMTLWVFAGRVIFGVPFGWAAVFSLFVMPVLVLMLIITTVLAFRQRRQPPRLSALQAWLHVALWLSLGFLGATIVDTREHGLDLDLEGGIREPENLSSVMTRILGWSPGTVLASVRLIYVFTVSTMLSWLALAIALAAGMITARRNPPANEQGGAPGRIWDGLSTPDP